MAATAGFAVTSLLLVLIAGSYLTDTFSSLDWQGGEYAYAFVWVTLGSVLMRAVVKAAAPAPWRSLGSGMLITGVVGIVVVLTLVVLFVQGVESMNPS